MLHVSVVNVSVFSRGGPKAGPTSSRNTPTSGFQGVKSSNVPETAANSPFCSYVLTVGWRSSLTCRSWEVPLQLPPGFWSKRLLPSWTSLVCTRGVEHLQEQVRIRFHMQPPDPNHLQVTLTPPWSLSSSTCSNLP